MRSPEEQIAALQTELSTKVDEYLDTNKGGGLHSQIRNIILQILSIVH